MKHVMLAAVVCGVVLVAGAADAADMLDNPLYASWAAHKPGTSVQMKATTTHPGGTAESVTTTTLKRVTAEKVVVEVIVSVVAGGRTVSMPAQSRDIPAKIAKQDPPKGGKKVDADVSQTTEKITTPAGTFKCNKATVKTSANGAQYVSTVWRNNEVPGMMVKSISGAKDGSMKSVSVLTKITLAK